MRVLLVESDPKSGLAVETRLEGAGHEVVRCTDAGAPSFPCAAVADGACPLDEPTDAVVATRSRPHPRPTAGEAGVSCALREGVPLVVAGNQGLNPFAPWASVTTDGDDDLLDAVAEAARSAPPVVVDAARHEAQRLLGDGAEVEVLRDGDRLSLTLSAPEVTDNQRLSAAAVKVLGAARQASRRTTTIDIGVADPGGDT